MRDYTEFNRIHEVPCWLGEKHTRVKGRRKKGQKQVVQHFNRRPAWLGKIRTTNIEIRNKHELPKLKKTANSLC
jgi:hypothetical protein